MTSLATSPEIRADREAPSSRPDPCLEPLVAAAGPRPLSRKHVAAVAGLLLLTAALSLCWSHAKLLSQDEIFVLQTDSVPNLRTLLQVQLKVPISLDPLFYHLLGFLSLKALQPQTPGGQAFALRLPSLLGFLLMQACLFVFVFRAGGAVTNTSSTAPEPATRRAAALACLLPALTSTLFYSAEARPYGLLLGLTGLLMVSWQTAAGRQHRDGALMLLALSLALALNTHYFAILLLLPLGIAELARFLQRRAIDWPMIAAISAGASAFALTLPFQHAAAEFRKNYYNLGSVTPHTITQAYRSLFVDYTEATPGVQHWTAIALLVCAAVLLFAVIRLFATTRSKKIRAELVFLLALSALPFAGFLVARFATHSFEARYVLGALPGLTALLALCLLPLLRRRGAFLGLMAALLLSVVGAGLFRVRAESERATALLSTLPVPESSLTTLGATAPVYIQEMGSFETARLYTPDLQVRSRLTLLYSRDQELRWDGHDTASLTAQHLRQFSAIPTATWDSLLNTPGPHLLILHHSGWTWTSQALDASRANVVSVSSAFGGEAVQVSWSQPLK